MAGPKSRCHPNPLKTIRAGKTFCAETSFEPISEKVLFVQKIPPAQNLSRLFRFLCKAIISAKPATLIGSRATVP